MTVLHAGGKFGKGGYKVSGGLHGVGVSVVNALSVEMTTRLRRNGSLYGQVRARGYTTQKLKRLGPAEGTGTYQWFKPDPEMFETLDFHWDILQKRLRELAFLNRGLSITLRDERQDPVREKTYQYEGGIVSFVEHLNDKKDPLHPIISTNGEREGVDIECALQWADTYSETVFASRTTSTRSKAGCISPASGRPSPTRSTRMRKSAGCSKSPRATCRRTTAWKG